MSALNLDGADEIAVLARAFMMRAVEQTCRGAAPATVQSAQLGVASALLARVLTVRNAGRGERAPWRGHGGWNRPGVRSAAGHLTSCRACQCIRRIARLLAELRLSSC